MSHWAAILLIFPTLSVHMSATGRATVLKNDSEVFWPQCNTLRQRSELGDLRAPPGTLTVELRSCLNLSFMSNWTTQFPQVDVCDKSTIQQFYMEYFSMEQNMNNNV